MLEKKPYFSVVIPLYNKEPHVKRSVSSVLGQSFSDFELIIINDASTDNSVKEVLKFNDKRIQLLHRSEPGNGGYKARNLGIEKANGQWIALLDADDEWFPEHLEKLYKLSGRYSEINFMSCGSILKKGNQGRINLYYLRHRAKGPHIINLKEYLINVLQKSQPVNSSIACIKSTSPVAMNLFPIGEEVKRNGDLYAWLKLLCFHREMAWSNHLGATIHRDSTNMITTTAPGSPYLFSRVKNNELSAKLNADEKLLLKKYFNRLIKSAWLGNVSRGINNFNLHKTIYWKGDYLNALWLTIIGLIPPRLINIYFMFRNNMRKGGYTSN
jgi:glycosyltransferase involved in cell wall biosynthesis